MLQAGEAKGRFLGDYLVSESPGELLIVGHLPESLLANAPAAVSVHRLSTLDDAEAMATSSALTDQQVPRTLVLALECNGHAGEVIVGRAVRSFPHRIFVHCGASQNETGLADESFFALGFHKLSLMEEMDIENNGARWFEYRLSDYKMAPDWLNARFWANPGRFDLMDDPDGFGEDADEDDADEDE